jgi:transcriptional regulator with XRE-family HTH domain
MNAAVKKKEVESAHPRSVNPMHVKMGNRIRAARIALGMSQNELGDVLGVSFQQVQKYEKGTNRVDSSRMIDIAAALNVTLEELMGYNGNPKQNAAQTQIDAMLATREGIQVLNAMAELNSAQRQFIVDVARRLPRLAAAAA